MESNRDEENMENKDIEICLSLRELLKANINAEKIAWNMIPKRITKLIAKKSTLSRSLNYKK